MFPIDAPLAGTVCCCPFRGLASENGEEKFPPKWNEGYIGAPVVGKQRQPTSHCAGISNIVFYALNQYRVLYALLAGCGLLRAGEALGLEIDKHISDDFRTLSIVQKAKRGEIQPYLKTKNGTREVNLCSQLANMLREYVGDRRSGLLFHSSTGAQLLQSNTLSDSLHPILDYMAHERGGFNILAGYFVIWFYWRGRNWARLLVLLTCLLCLYNLRYFFRGGIVERVMVGSEAVLAVFLLFWLNSRSVKSFFHAPKDTQAVPSA